MCVCVFELKFKAVYDCAKLRAKLRFHIKAEVGYVKAAYMYESVQVLYY